MTTLGIFCYVRNESRLLGQALESIRPVADELVVIDTGSTDNTIEIAKRVADRVLEWPWPDDFAAASNYGASLMTSDYAGKWDADWLLTSESLPLIRQLKQRNFDNYNLLEGTLVNEFDPDGTPRMRNKKSYFYRHSQFEWVGAAHDYLLPTDATRRAEYDWTYNHRTSASTPQADWIGFYPALTVYHHKQPGPTRHTQTLDLIRHELTRATDHATRTRLVYFALAQTMFVEDYVAAQTYLDLLPPSHSLIWAHEYQALIYMATRQFDTLYMYLHSLPSLSPQLRLVEADYHALHDPARAVLLYEQFLTDYPYTRADLNVNFTRFVDHPRLMLHKLQEIVDSGPRSS